MSRLIWHLYRRWERQGRFPFWARLFWPRIHWCAEFDEMLVLGELGDYCCSCVEWPKRHLKEQERLMAECAAKWGEEGPL